MNKMGVFFTLGAILILMIVIFLVVIRGDEAEEISQINVQYTKHKSLVDYVNDIEEKTLPALVKTSEKASLLYLSQDAPVSGIEARLEENVNGAGNIDENLTLWTLVNRTLVTFSAPVYFEDIDYDVTSVSQPDPWTIVIKSTVSFRIESITEAAYGNANITWDNSVNYTTVLSAIGLFDYLESDYVTTKWQANASKACMARIIDNSIDCESVEGLCPLTGC